jgi:hypothetical protein
MGGERSLEKCMVAWGTYQGHKVITEVVLKLSGECGPNLNYQDREPETGN